MTRGLRTYGPMKKKPRQHVGGFVRGRSVVIPLAQAVIPDMLDDPHAVVAARAEGRCEVVIDGARCRRGWVDQHHTKKPRRSYDTAEYRIAVCRAHHDRCDWPYKRGRLVITPNMDGTFRCAVVTAPDKFTYTRDRLRLEGNSMREDRRQRPTDGGVK